MCSDITQKKYRLYDSEELLQDDFFVMSMIHPTLESEAFWREMLEQKEVDASQYRLARYFINCVQASSEVLLQRELHAVSKQCPRIFVVEIRICSVVA